MERTAAQTIGTGLRGAVLPGLVLAYGVGAVVHALSAGAHGAAQLHPLLHWLRDSTLAAPLAVLITRAAMAPARGIVRAGDLRGAAAALAWALPAAVLNALATMPAGAVSARLLAGAAGHPPPLAATGRNAGAALVTGLVVLLATAFVRGLPQGPATRVRLPRPAPRRSGAALRRMAATAMTAAVAAPAVLGAVPAAATEAGTADAPPACSAQRFDRTYDVAAINVHLPYNRWGDADPNGLIYVLQHDKEAVRHWDEPLSADPSQDVSSNRRLRPRPLVLRANEGECVRVNFRNELPDTLGEGLPSKPYASMSVRGIPYDVQTSGGSNAGYNDDTTVSNVPGANAISYYWTATTEGIYFFNDTATPAGSEADGGSLSHGLFGAFVVEPAGSTWTDPVSGAPLYTGTRDRSGELYIDAVITPPAGRAFRESIQIAQDEMPPLSTFGFNYGSEPQHNRDSYKCPDCVGEETSLSSWAYGDPALVKLASGRGPWLPQRGATTDAVEDCGLGTPGFESDSCYVSNVTHSYANDPMKIRYGMAGAYETHVFHMHANQWLAEDKDTGAAGSTPSQPGPGAMPESSTIDSQTFGPMEMFTADLLFGAGSKPGTVGDAIFHCHLYPHFAAGFWALQRTHDVLEDGSGTTPDGVRVHRLLPLSDGVQPPAPTADNPGFPRFIPGEFGWRAPQPPLAITEGGPDGEAAPRIVAGKMLTTPESDPRLAVERNVADLLSGGRSVPGAPFRDPCPSGAREVTYNVSAIQTDIVYNEHGDHDTQGRILVLDSEVDDVLAGRKNPDPLFFRVNAGDCINFNLTNRLPNWFGNDAFLQKTQTNMFGQHIHLVKFDVLASDGSSNGWNYQQAAFSGEQAAFNRRIATDPTLCTEQGCRLSLPDDVDPTASSDDVPIGQTIHERWYADYELRTVFTHDHHFAAVDQNRGQFGALVVEPAGVDFRDPATGTWRQPVNDPAHGTTCGSACEGDATGTAMEIVGPGPDDDFREYGLAVQDYVSLTRAGGDPQDPADVINPPLAPEEFPDEDPGTMAINYRNAPLDMRATKNGQPVDPAYVFSSHVFGDPATPLLEAYTGDNVRLRVIQGSQEEQHQFIVHGMRWREEPDDPDSPWVNAQPVGISEAFNFEVPMLSCNAGEDCRGDYLYGSTGIDDLYTGVWGILRVHGGTVPGLRPLPDNRPSAAGSVPSKSPTALAPPPREAAGEPCPTGAPVRQYDVVAMQARITYNAAGDHDPYGLVYALADDEAAIRDGRNPEPLVLRANEGDCVEVTLTNKLTSTFQQHTGVDDGDARVPTEKPAPRVPGLRVSLHPQLLKYDVRGSDGAAVGFNRDQTAGPGETITYRWHALDVTPGELGAVNLTDYGDVRGHRHHGLLAALVVEPKEATWHDPVTGEPLAAGASADIRMPGRPDFREHVAIFADGLNLRHASGAVIANPLEHDLSDDGEKAFNYRNEPFRHRLGYEPFHEPQPSGADLAKVYSSKVHGDPATPLFRAYAGDEVRMRILNGGDKQRQHAFSLDGHAFRAQPDDPGSRVVGTLSGIGPGSAVNAEMGPAGGPAGAVGDYLYGDSVGLFQRSGGLWGLLRVYPQPGDADAMTPTPLGDVDDPRAGGHPLLPLEPERFAPAPPPVAVPGAPTAVQAKAGRASATVTWAAPDSDGGAAVSGYTVTAVRRSDGVATTLELPADARSATVGGLVNGQAYSLHVTAANSAGLGEPSAESAPVIPATVPDAPLLRTATSGWTRDRTVTASVRWSPPASDGGAAIAGYRIIAVRMGTTRRLTMSVGADARRATFEGLARNAVYRFRVEARNRVGYGRVSARSARVTAR